MATVNLVPDKTYYYDPDGPNAPLTMLFPAIGGVDGQRIRFANQTSSTTQVTLDAGVGQTLNDPEDLTTYAQTHTVARSQIMYEYISKGTQWRLVNHGKPDLTRALLGLYAYAGYGGLRLAAPPVAFPDITATYQKINVFDATAVAIPRGIVQDLANDRLGFTNEGVYMVMVNLSMEFTQSQSGRITYISLYNETDAVQSATAYPIGVGRNTEAAGITIPIMLDVPAADAGDLISLYIGGGDTVAGVSIQSLSYVAWNIGEWRGTL